MAIELGDLERRTAEAVTSYWQTLAVQSSRQRSGDADRGGRAAATGGQQMNGFCQLVRQTLVDNGLPATSIFADAKLELPGYFRANKKWDMLVIHRGRLLAALEFKSQVGPSFGNNFNNRSEEAIGTAQDLWTAYREGAFAPSQRPFLGWLMLVESCAKSLAPVEAKEPHFPVFPEFHGASYARRYELLLRRLVHERLYDRAALVLSTSAEGQRGVYAEPASDLKVRQFLAALVGHVSGILAT